MPELRQRLHASGLEFVCLYRGEIPDDLAQVAPYLVALNRSDEFTAWIVQQGWGNAWGIFARVDSMINMTEVRKHFRTFLKVEFPDGKSRYFRYYDPRVLFDYLPTCNRDELSKLFGPTITSYVVEAEEQNVALQFTLQKGLLVCADVKLR
ncbi:MAG: DUF4123 domain-containing protein [Gammaproteobacteria bacterium]|nr:DUF4123 domain-containing protein [Gammaproteobacteria bacterium]